MAAATTVSYRHYNIISSSFFYCGHTIGYIGAVKLFKNYLKKISAIGCNIQEFLSILAFSNNARFFDLKINGTYETEYNYYEAATTAMRITVWK